MAVDGTASGKDEEPGGVDVLTSSGGRGVHTRAPRAPVGRWGEMPGSTAEGTEGGRGGTGVDKPGRCGALMMERVSPTGTERGGVDVIVSTLESL